MKTFSCQFDGGTTCTVQVADTLPPQGQAHIKDFRWTGPAPTKAVLASYTDWIHTVNQQLADEWKAIIMHVFLMPHGRHECWEYHPGGKPILVS